MPKYNRLLRKTLFILGRQPIKAEVRCLVAICTRCLSMEMDVTDILINKKGVKSNLRHINYLDKCQGNIPPPAVIDAQVVGCGYPGTPRSLMINLTHFKYLFNCGEGTQRICREHKMKPSKIKDIFFTRKSWTNVGGLVSLCFSLEGMGVPGLRLHGPHNLEKVVTEAKGFTQTTKLMLQIVKADIDLGSYEDSAMYIHYIPMRPRESTAEEPVMKKPRLTDNCDSFCVAYLCQPKPKTRNVDLEKCVELGVSKGVMIGQLTKGFPVTLDDGKVIQPEDILVAPAPNPPFLVLECPSIAHLESLLEHPKVQEFHSSSIEDVCPCLIFHMTPDEVLKEAKYREWMQRFPENTKHIIMNESCSGLVFEGVYKIQTMLNMVHSDIFPLLPEITQTQHNTFEEQSSASNIVYGRTNLRYVIRGKNRGDVLMDDCITLKPEEYRNEVLKDETCASALKEPAGCCEEPSERGEPFPEVLFLGTGSAEPNKVRNVSGIWVNVSADSCLLLDCGENTVGQLLRHYGNDADDMFTKLKAVFISHLHADHHLGVTDVAMYRKKVLQSRGLDVSPLLVIGSKPLEMWNEFLSDMFPDVFGLIRIIPIGIFNKHFEGKKPVEYREVLDLLEMKHIESVRVRHGGIPFGMVITHQSGWKLVYSGDTMPAYGLVKAGMDCDLLIHEATMEDDMTEDAQAKKHSQRYPKIPLFNDNFSDKVGIAFDNMRVRLSELQILPMLKEKLKAVFAEDINNLELEAIKRTVSKRRKQNNKDEKNLKVKADDNNEKLQEKSATSL
ncbi:hypothetical protein LSH36_158g04026 [Paralvinella palmiformis]|uniref:ribonuclease Z n=1 Tax=Paralvinella palmiformis TaxID=53620 RepID=A0AAD9JTQ9_9ANNE|nr:hypothetical protein LSH36_158g04026 [Paralvinella palmiformis]